MCVRVCECVCVCLRACMCMIAPYSCCVDSTRFLAYVCVAIFRMKHFLMDIDTTVDINTRW